MNIFQYAANRIELSRQRKNERKLLLWIRDLEDQVISGQLAIKRANTELGKVRADIFALEPPDDIVRRAGVA